MTSAATTIRLTNWQPATPPVDDDPGAIVEWAAQRFEGKHLIFSTAFGMEGVVLLDMLTLHLPDLHVFYVDTGFLFEETHRLREKLERRFPDVIFEAVHPHLSPAEQAAAFTPELWKSDPDLCCKLRKVEPLHRAMRDADVWFAALRRDQSETRRDTKIVDWNWTYQLIKVCPLVTWTRRQVYDYIVEHDLPYNELHEQGYPTLGCTHCTRPVEGSRPWDYSRDGRWAGRSKSECGLHGYGI